MKRAIYMASIAIISLSLTACFKSPTEQLGEKAGEMMVEKAIESQTGGKVDVDADGGTVDFKSEDGSMQVSTGGEVSLPDGFPKELVIAEDAKITVASVANGTYSVSYATNDETASLFEAYKKNLAEGGWKKTMETMAEDVNMLAFDREAEKLTVVIAPNQDSGAEGKAIVSLILGSK